MLDSPLPDAIATVISEAIMSASHITRLGLACPSEQLRERAAEDLANDIVARLEADTGQFTHRL